MSIKGMPDFITPAGADKSIAFWLAARLLSAFGLLAVALLPWRPLRHERTRWWFMLGVVTLVVVVAWVVLWHPGWLPRTFIEGQGLTDFKLYVEYLLVALFLAAAWLFYRKMSSPQDYDVVGLFAATCVMALSELVFTLYTTLFDVILLTGHVFKVIAYLYVCRAIFVGNVTAPYRRLQEAKVQLEREVQERERVEEQLRQSNEFLEERVSQRTRQLEVATRQAESASETKSRFLANMSHDIRTPMGSIIGMANLALQADLNPRQRDYVEKIHRSANDLLGILNDILDISRIEAGKLEIEQRDFTIDGVFDRLSGLFADAARQKGLALRFSRSPELAGPLRGDPMRLTQVLTNFIGNAIKFTERGEVDVVARPRVGAAGDGACALRFEVRDTGIGIRPELVPLLFTPFQQGDASTTRKYGGTGLGLAISRQLAGLMGGSVGVDSEPGKGSTFWLELTLPRGGDAGAGAGPSRPAATGTLDGARVLLAEDNVLNQQVAREMLAAQGARVTVVGNGRAAIDALRRDSFDCVLMDVQMPGMDGIEATREIRANPAWMDLPVIAMTANASPADQLACCDAGMNDFVSKPFEPDAMLACVRSWVRPLVPPATNMSPETTTPTITTAKSPVHAAAGEVIATDVPVGSGDDIVDLSVLARICDGDQAMVRKYAATFTNSIESDLAAIDTAHATGDMVQLARMGHRGKSAALTMGATAYAGLCESLERAAGQRDAARVSALVTEMHAVAAAVIASIRSRIS